MGCLGRPLFFAWFNIGDHHLSQADYLQAAAAYDHTTRYQDLINLANTTLAVMSEPVLEETYYWRGRAYDAMGELDLAVNDYLLAIELNPNYEPAYAELYRLGIEIEAEEYQ